jgi:ADP-ribose pyrophosphatase YjhB (NUDIX family)
MGSIHSYRKRRERCALHFKIEELLSVGELAEYETLIEAAGTTNKQAWEWLKSKGHVVSLSAVARHRRRFLSARKSGAEAAMAARAFMAGIGEFSPGLLARAMVARTGLEVFMKLMRAEEVGLVEYRDLAEIAKAVRELVSAERELLASQALPAAAETRRGGI